MDISLSTVIKPQLFVTFFPIGLVLVAAGIIENNFLESFSIIQHIISERKQKMWVPFIACVPLSLLYQIF